MPVAKRVRGTGLVISVVGVRQLHLSKLAEHADRVFSTWRHVSGAKFAGVETTD